jgi:signal transduction histidine kinase
MLMQQVEPIPAADRSDSIAAAIAHEVNNLLTPVIGLADLLEHTGGDADIRDRLIERAVERCQRAVAICGLLVDLQKDGSSASPRCSLANTLSAAIDAARPKADSAGVRLECSFDDTGSVDAPATAVEHIILNLLLNAIAASPPGSSVTVTAGYTPPSTWRRALWTLHVGDRGGGLEPRVAAAINQGRHPAGSSGIGLAVVRLLCQRWDGRISVDSEVDLGTTFHVELPAA